MKIIFLDIDGVLNHEQFYINRQEQIFAGKWSITRPFSEIDPKCVNLLSEFCRKNDIKVVISSTWRASRDAEAFNEMFSNEFFEQPAFEVISTTPHLPRWSVRGNEIRQWIEENENIIGCKYYDYYDYCILDDDGDMLLWQKENFLKVDRFVGITPQTIFEMKKIFRLKLHDWDV
ncbi:MAG: HAD domain-containing protein [Draconibacterium sp.]|nr:HAD domain-containing protein [Draconibacterium sp.]